MCAQLPRRAGVGLPAGAGFAPAKAPAPIAIDAFATLR